MSTPRVSAKRSEHLLEVLSQYPRLLIVSHDNPDPDALASGWAVKRLVEERLGTPVRFVAGGDVVRAENRHMLRLLRVPVELLLALPDDPDAGTVLVDCSPASLNRLSAPNLPVVAVIDHHQPWGPPWKTPFQDFRPGVAATATLTTCYLREQKVEPGPELATALVYALRSETQGCETHYSSLDRKMLPWLVTRADPALLAEIENAPLSRSYYRELVLALQNTYLYDDVAFCLLPRADAPEIVGEVADLLIRCEGVQRVLCGAVCRGEVWLSARTDEAGGNATVLLQEAIRDLGHGGGHEHRAGGKLGQSAITETSLSAIDVELRNRWLAVCGIARRKGSRLVTRQEILEHLD